MTPLEAARLYGSIAARTLGEAAGAPADPTRDFTRFLREELAQAG